MSGVVGDQNSDLTQQKQEALATFSYAFKDMNRNKNESFDLKTNFLNAIIYQKINAERDRTNENYRRKLQEQVKSNEISNQTAKSKRGVAEHQNYNLTQAIVAATKLSNDAVGSLSMKDIFELQNIDDVSAQNYIRQAVSDIANDTNVDKDNIKEQIKFLDELKGYLNNHDRELVGYIDKIKETKSKVKRILTTTSEASANMQIEDFLMYPAVVNNLHSLLDKNNNDTQFLSDTLDSISSASKNKDYGQYANLLGLTHHIAKFNIPELQPKIGEVYNKFSPKKSQSNVNGLSKENYSHLDQQDIKSTNTANAKPKNITSHNLDSTKSEIQKAKTIEYIDAIIKQHANNDNKTVLEILNRLKEIVEKHVDDKMILDMIKPEIMGSRIPNTQGVGLYGSYNLNKNTNEISSDNKNEKICSIDSYLKTDDFKADLASADNINKWKGEIENLVPIEGDTSQQIQYKLNKLDEISQVLFQTLRYNNEHGSKYLDQDQISKIIDLHQSVSQTFDQHKRMSDNNIRVYNDTYNKIAMTESEIRANNNSNKLR